MAQTIGSKNKVITVPDVCALSPEQRIELLANLIIDRILEDQTSGQKVLKKIGNGHGNRDFAAA